MSDTSRAPYGAETGTGGTFGTGSTGSFGTGGSAESRGGSMVNTVTDKASEIVDQAKPTVDAGMDKAASGLQTAAETLRERGESMGQGQVASIATMTADKLESGAEMLRGTDSSALMIEMENMIRRKPVESLAVAAGVGFLLAKALR